MSLTENSRVMQFAKVFFAYIMRLADTMSVIKTISLSYRHHDRKCAFEYVITLINSVPLLDIIDLYRYRWL